MYEAVIPYRPRAEGELRLQAGDKVSRSQDVGGGWVIAFNHRSQETGLVPLVCLTLRHSGVSRRLTRLVTRSQRQPPRPGLLSPGGVSDGAEKRVSSPCGPVGTNPPQQTRSSDSLSAGPGVEKVDEEHGPLNGDAQQSSEEGEISIAVPPSPAPSQESAENGASTKSLEIPQPSPVSSRPSSGENKQNLLQVPQTVGIEMSVLDQHSEEGTNDSLPEKPTGNEECSISVEPEEATTKDESSPAVDSESRQLRSAMLKGRAKRKTVSIVIPESSKHQSRRRRRRKGSRAEEVEVERDADLELKGGSCCRLLLSLLMSVVVVAALYGVLVMIFHVDPPNAVLACSVTLCFMCLGQLLSRHCRALIVLSFPSLFTALGRVVMLSVITAKILVEPGANILNNSRLVAETVACVLDTALNHSLAHADRGPDPAHLARVIQHGGDDLRIEMMRHLQNAAEELHRRQQKCGPASVGADPGLMQNTTWPPPSEGGADLNQSEVTPGGFFCPGGMRNWSDVVENVTAHFNGTLGSVALSHSEPGTQPAMDQSRPTDGEEVKTQRLTMEEVEDHLRDPINLCAELAGYLRKLLLLALVLVFVQSYLYLRRYLSRYSFDNMFITSRLMEIDIERRRMGLHGVFPLRRRERKRYVDLTSWKLSPLEKSQSKSALVVFFFHMLIYAMVLLVDFLLFYLLTLMTRQLKNEHPPATTSPQQEVKVSGTGFLAKLLTDITSSFANDSSSPGDFTQDFHACLTDFSQIDRWSIWSTLAMYLATLLIIVLHGYGSRLRQRILAFYYPLQHEARTQHLYLNIYIKRKSFIREARDMIQPCVAAGEETEGFLERKAASVSLFRSLCPCLKEPVFKCHNCKRYSSHMRRCSGEGCSTILCRDCLVDSSGLCPNCIDVEEEEESEELLSDSPTKNLISA